MRIGTEELFLYSSTDVEVHASGTILIVYITLFLNLFLFCNMLFGNHLVSWHTHCRSSALTT